MDARNGKGPEEKRGGEPLLRRDLLASRRRLYDRIRIPLRTLDIIIYALAAALVLAILLGIGSNR